MFLKQERLISLLASSTFTSCTQDHSRCAASNEIVQGVVRFLADLGSETGRGAEHSSQRGCKRGETQNPAPQGQMHMYRAHLETHGAVQPVLWETRGKPTKIWFRLGRDFVSWTLMRLSITQVPLGSCWSLRS